MTSPLRSLPANGDNGKRHLGERGSFSAAADDLQITPSAASRHVSKLEKVLGLQLIRRTTRQFRLTDAGKEAFGKCSELVAAAQGTMQVAQRFTEKPQGLVRVSAPKAFAKHVLHPLILDFLNQYPAVDMQLPARPPMPSIHCALPSNPFLGLPMT